MVSVIADNLLQRAQLLSQSSLNGLGLVVVALV